jgi:uncharacterized radical SAM superfamily protein
MQSSITENIDIFPALGKQLNPAELKIDLLCRGLRIDGACRIGEEGRPLSNSPADPASGLEMIIPGDMSELWVNVPIREKFVENSPYYLMRVRGAHRLFDERYDLRYSVKLPRTPGWYDFGTKRGIPMSRVGTLQGTCLSVSLEEQCRFEAKEAAAAGGKTIEDVVETAAMAQKESGVTFAYLRGGPLGSDGLASAFPYLKALKQEVGILVGVLFPPEADLELYYQARALGADHVSFSLEFFNRDYFDRFARGRSKAVDQKSYFRALEYCARAFGKGRVSGEIIAGIEPIGDSLRAVDYFAGIGVLPLVRIFRPLPGTNLEKYPPPRFAEMVRVFRRVYEACSAHNLPVGMMPNIHLSVLPQPEDTLYLAPDSPDSRTYRSWVLTMKQVMRPYFLRRMRKSKARTS